MRMNMKTVNRLDTTPNDHRLQVEFAIGAFGCVTADEIYYISTPISSGKRLYEYMKKKGFATPAEARKDREAFYQNVIAPNIQESLAWAKIWDAKTSGVIIAPADFEKCRSLKDVKWTQDDFMGMWLSLINDKVTHMVMQDGWAYSDGASEEYLQAICMQTGRRGRNNISVMDTDGKEIKLNEGILTLSAAFKDLHEQGLRPEGLAKTLARLLLLESRYSSEQDYGQTSEPGPHLFYNVSASLPDYDRKSFLPVAKEVMCILDNEYNEILTSLETLKSIEYTPMNVLVREKIDSSVTMSGPHSKTTRPPRKQLKDQMPLF